MKRKTLCAFSLILYVLVVCTLLSQKIEVEMQTQVEAHTVYGSRIFEQEIELPISYLFSQDSTSHLFEIKDGTGWESGLRSQEISSQDWSVRRTTPDLEKVILNPGRDYTFICTASRVPQSGELVEVIDEPEIAADTYLVYYPEGVPNFDELPSGTKEISRSENTLLLSVENGKYPFFEHRAIGDDLKQIAASHMRVFSLSAVQSFLEQIPSLTWVLVLLIIPVLLWAFSCVLSINADRNKPFIALNILLVIVCLFLLQSVLAKIDLPAVMLPDENIFDLHIIPKSSFWFLII